MYSTAPFNSVLNIKTYKIKLNKRTKKPVIHTTVDGVETESELMLSKVLASNQRSLKYYCSSVKQLLIITI